MGYMDHLRATCSPAFASVSSIYFVTAIALTVFNKYMASPQYFGFPYASSMIAFHLLCSFGFAAVFCYFVLRGTPYALHPDWPTRITWSRMCLSYMPVGVLLSLDIMLTQTAFEYSSVTLTLVIKAIVPACVMVYEWYIGRSELTLLKVSVIAAATLGIIFASLGEFRFDVRGLVAAMAAAAVNCTRLIVTEHLLAYEQTAAQVIDIPDADEERDPELPADAAAAAAVQPPLKPHPVMCMLYFAPAGCAVLIMWAMRSEFDLVYHSRFFEPEMASTTLGLLFAGAVMGFTVNLSVLYTMQMTSALTMCILGIAKFVMTVATSNIVFATPVSHMKFLGVVLSSVGVAGYNYNKYRERQLKIGAESGNYAAVPMQEVEGSDSGIPSLKLNEQ